MRHVVVRCLAVVLWVGMVGYLHADGVQVVRESRTPNSVRPVIGVVSADWIGQVPPTGRVNAPQFLTSLYPGQKIALVLVTEGPDRDKLLNDASLDVQFSSSSQGVTEQHGLKVKAARQIKAEGADMAMMVLNAGGIAQKDKAEMERVTSLVTFTVFMPDWTVPVVKQAEEVQILVTLSGGSVSSTIEPVKIGIRPASDWMKEPGSSREQAGKYLNRYHEDLSPGYLLSLFKAAASLGDLDKPAVYGYFVIAYRENVAARKAAIELFPFLDRETQGMLMVIFRLGGLDVGALLPETPSEVLENLKAMAPLKDPRQMPYFKDPVSPEEAGGIGNIMDQCWAGWMATGDKSYLRALVGLLEGAADYPALQAWTKAKGGVKGLNAKVARGLAYQIAGWSIGAFQRTDPHVADWLLFWENDPACSPLLRKELAALAGNPAFRRN